MTQGDPEKQARGAGRKLAAVLLGLLGLIGAPSGSREAQTALRFHPTDLAIYSPDGQRLLGHGRYTITQLDGATLVKGENKFLDGERDVELDRIEPATDRQSLVLTSFQHSFFNADGSPKLVADVDFKSGTASCTQYSASGSVARTANLDFPPDTYAGASLLIPIESALREGAQGSIKLHAFNCVPDPRVVAVEARVASSRSSWPFYAGDLVRVEVRPDLGWLSVLAAPFVPKLYAWFDPDDDWNYVGGRLERFYRGPKILLVRMPSGPSFEAGPAFRAPRDKQRE